MRTGSAVYADTRQTGSSNHRSLKGHGHTFQHRVHQGFDEAEHTGFEFGRSGVGQGLRHGGSVTVLFAGGGTAEEGNAHENDVNFWVAVEHAEGAFEIVGGIPVVVVEKGEDFAPCGMDANVLGNRAALGNGLV